MGKRLLDKLWERHVVATNENGLDLLYIDLHLVHEVTSPQAFEGLRLTNRTVRRPDLTFARCIIIFQRKMFEYYRPHCEAKN